MVESLTHAAHDVVAAVSEALAIGWASCEVTLDQAYEIAITKGVEIVPTRRGSAPIGVLQAVDCPDAHPRSLSARYGRGELPLHTDAAHLQVPPTIVMLQADDLAHGVPTLLQRLAADSLPPRALACMKDGVFVVGAGRSSFCAHAMDSAGTTRFDPVCMRPLDRSARYVIDFLADASVSAEQYEWREYSELLVIDNRTTLHGRPTVREKEERKLRRLMLHWPVQ